MWIIAYGFLSFLSVLKWGFYFSKDKTVFF